MKNFIGFSAKNGDLVAEAILQAGGERLPTGDIQEGIDGLPKLVYFRRPASTNTLAVEVSELEGLQFESAVQKIRDRMNQEGKAISQLKIIGDLIIEAVNESGKTGLPGGTLYAALMQHGCDIHTFEGIMNGLVIAKKIRRQGQIYYGVKA